MPPPRVLRKTRSLDGWSCNPLPDCDDVASYKSSRKCSSSSHLTPKNKTNQSQRTVSPQHYHRANNNGSQSCPKPSPNRFIDPRPATSSGHSSFSPSRRHHHRENNNGSQFFPKPSPNRFIDPRPATSSGHSSFSPSRRKKSHSPSSSPVHGSPSSRVSSPSRRLGAGATVTRTQPSPSAATSKLFHRAEFQNNINSRSNYWKKFRVVMPHSTSNDVLALTYKDRKHWNDKHKVGGCLTHLTKGEIEV